MRRLSQDILEYIFTLLEPVDLITCAAVCRGYNRAIHDSVVLQLALRQYLHQSSLYDGERTYPVAERLRRLVVRERNLDLVKPRIHTFDLPEDEILHTVSGRYVVTQPAEQAERADDDGKWVLCTVWVWGKPRKIKVDFKPFTDMIDLDIHQDVVVVQQDESTFGLTKGNVLLRFFRLFNNTEDAEEYTGTEIRILEDDWNGPEPHNISLTTGGRFMVWCGGVVWIYDWQKREALGRLPPHSSQVWRSNLGMAWAGKGIVLGLDMPHELDIDETQSASLAVFQVDTKYPGTSSLPLQLELPFCIDLLDSTVRDLLHLEPSDTVAIIEDNIPHISRNGPLGLILVATEFVINEDNEMRLLVVLPTKELERFQLQEQRKKPRLSHAWGDEWNPFVNIDSVPFSQWRKHAYTWAEPKASPSYYIGLYETQNSFRLLNYSYSDLKLSGKLHLTILNFNKRRLTNFDDDSRTLGGLGKKGATETDLDHQERREPVHYRRTVIPATADNMGCVEITADFFLGHKVAADTSFFCGERLFIQQRALNRVWVLDFGVQEIAGRLGQVAKAEARA